MRHLHLILLSSLILVTGCELFGSSKVDELDKKLDEKEFKFAQLEKEFKAADDARKVEIEKALAELDESYAVELEERNKEAEKSSGTGAAVTAILSLVAIFTGLGIIGGVGKMAGDAIARKKRKSVRVV